MAWEVCASIRAEEIVIFDKAYVDFDHLYHLHKRSVNWVTRAKENICYKIMGQQPIILSDCRIKMQDNTAKKYPDEFHLIKALVQIDDTIREMQFITNNLEWSAYYIFDLYLARWAIEVFFKEIKQTLQIADFLGTSEMP